MKTLIKKSIFLALVFAAMLFLSCCGVNDEPISEPPSSEAAEATPEETTTGTLSEEELDELAQNMPEIVFVMSHHYYDTNILGFYITNAGEVKMFDFRQIEPDEIYAIPDVYDRLEEAICHSIEPIVFFNYDDTLTEDELPVIPENELIISYKKLLKVNENSTHIEYESMVDMVRGYYDGYGIRYNQNNEQEIVLLYSGGDYIYQRDDENSNELFYWLRFEKLPNIPLYHD